MEGMGKQRRPRRAFTSEFKAEIVEVCRRGDRSVGQVAQDFDLTETAVRDWVRQADLDAGVRTDGLTSAEREEPDQAGAASSRPRRVPSTASEPSPASADAQRWRRFADCDPAGVLLIRWDG